jgi:hypothetical protein
MKEIQLTQGKVAIVDDDDFEWLARQKWHYAHGYAANSKFEYMHRIILPCPGDMQVDHKNHDGLDNRRCNIRICTASQNIANNRKPTHGITSIYKGVHFEKFTKKWRAQIMHSGKSISLGRFETQDDAHNAYIRASREIYKDFSLE